MSPRPLWIAGRLLTRLPFPDPGRETPAETGRSVVWYPLVGLIMGTLLALAGTALDHADAGVAAALILILWVWSSGGIHLDGLGDSADAWVGGLGSRERTLDIMKDPRCGPAAVSAIVLVLIAKWSGIQALMSGDAPWMLVLMPFVGRMQLSWLLLTTPYAREQGMAADQSRHLPRRATWLSTLASAFLCLLLSGWAGLILLGLTLSILILARRRMLDRIAGFTGDTAGALVEITETLVLLTCAILAAPDV
ncbi:adenosylcobinamide-GDP ribazoletransferase [Imhoffiella purpurea]|uniref:Adenosylcobinamide-GDP ribazoletransferase n=1 Tax=Imhoffiella purpurea TaxID=1249627 RepID=W9VBF0_9GAMM|nr:adenosylcobinamide-GDP ribazoletransferase [Imhoffiella purpurea]EXJ14291.1 Cobalamin synthase [Imhoffiella purpurea]